MRVLSLFSGIGGIDLGVERAGMTVVAQSEIDPYACRVLAKHWPDVPNLGDITQITESDLEPIGPIDLVCGGFPCQPVSVAGKQLAQEDKRWLWPEVARMLRIIRPRYALLENTPGLITANDGGAFRDVLGDLAALGYDAIWTRLGACHVGAPHRRLRIFVVAWRAADADRFRRCIRAGARSNGAGVAQLADSVSADARGEQLRIEQGRVAGAGRAGATFARYDGEAGDASDSGGRSWRPQQDERSQAGIETPRRNDAQRRALAGPAADAFGDRLQGLLAAGTATGATLGDRDGFWRDFPAAQPCLRPGDDGLSGRVARLKSIGNAVVPQVAEHVGRCIMGAL